MYHIYFYFFFPPPILSFCHKCSKNRKLNCSGLSVNESFNIICFIITYFVIKLYIIVFIYYNYIGQPRSIGRHIQPELLKFSRNIEVQHESPTNRILLITVINPQYAITTVSTLYQYTNVIGED